MKELTENIELYLLNEPYLGELLHRVYTKRKKELDEEAKQGLMLEELMKDVPKATLAKAKVSSIELKEIKRLIKFDKDIFARESEIHPVNDLLEDNPYSFFVNFDRLPAKIPENIKQLLYRPERMARLNKAYHRLAVLLKNDWLRKVQERAEVRKNRNRRIDWHDRQPAKTAEEFDLIDAVVKTLDKKLKLASDDGMRYFDETSVDLKPPIDVYSDVRDWYKPFFQKMLEERRKVPKAERERAVGDSVDEVDTTDLEHFAFRGIWQKPSPDGQETIQETLNQKVEQERLFRKRVTQEMFGQMDFDDPGVYKMKQDEKEAMEKMSHEERLEYKKRKVASMMTVRAE